MGRKLNEKQIK